MRLLILLFNIVVIVTAAGLHAAPKVVGRADSSCIDTLADSANETIETDEQEGEYQEGLNALFTPESLAIDTTEWNTSRINSTRFDYRRMSDTVLIILENPDGKRRYVQPAIGSITSPFGMRKCLWHYGIDIRVKKGDTIRCAFNGIVRVIQNDRHGYGKVVVVRHPDGLETLYGHLSKTLVVCNQRVNAGDIIGRGGNTGHSTGNHLHFEIRFRGEPFDPNYIIDFTKYSLKKDTLVLTRDNFAYLDEARKIICHVIRKGETLGTIARHYGTTVQKLCAINRIKAKTVLTIGRKIVIRPTPLSLPQLSSKEKGDGEKTIF